MDWQVLNTGYAAGHRNMAFDVALAEELLALGQVNTLRLYGWSPPAISLGWNQSDEALDRERVLAAGIDIVRRPTGGRAILHSDELTYSVVMLSATKNVLEVYDTISKALVCGLRSLGVEAALEQSQPHFPTEYRRRSSVACFTSSARHEITVGGRKLVGSAQRRYARSDGLEVVLQHGSILLGPDHQRIVEFFAESDPQLKAAVESELRLHTTDLLEATGRRIPFAQVASAVQHGFEESWGIRFATASSERAQETMEKVS